MNWMNGDSYFDRWWYVSPGPFGRFQAALR